MQGNIMDGLLPKIKIIGAGLPRTGTYSLKQALQSLGYKCYHFEDIFTNIGHSSAWAQYITEHSTGDDTSSQLVALLCELLSDYDAVVDLPLALFHKELNTMCPNATVLLTTRDVDSWTDSMTHLLDTVETVRRNRWFLKYVSSGILDNFLVITEYMHNRAFPDVTRQGLKDAYHHHKNTVLEFHPRVRVVELGEGWEPLCEVLQTNIPDIPYPCLNSQASLLKIHIVRHVAWNVLNWYLIPLVVMVLALYFIF